MPFKATMLFQQGTGQAAGGATAVSHLGGWSESVYFFSDDIAALRNRLYTSGAWGPGLCPARAALLAASGSIVGVRIQKVFPKSGRSQTAKVGFPGVTGNLTDVPQMALNCTIGALTAINVRRFCIRGIPDSMVVRGEYSPSFAFISAITSYFIALGNFNFPGLDQTENVYDVLTVNAAGIVTTSVANNWAIGNRIHFSSIKKTSGTLIATDQQVLALGPGLNQVTLSAWPYGDCTGGKAQRITINLYLMDTSQANVDRASVRKVGRPFDQYRGRRSKAS